MVSADNTYPGRGLKREEVPTARRCRGEGIGAHRQAVGEDKARGFSVYISRIIIRDRNIVRGGGNFNHTNANIN